MMNKEQRKKVIEDYYGLVEVVIDKLLSTSKYRTFKHLRDDLLGEGYEGLIWAIDTYDPEKKVKPVTYFSMCIRGRAQDYIKKYMRTESTQVYIEDIGLQITDEEVDEYTEDWTKFVDKYEPEGERDKIIYHQILMGSRSYQEVADDLGQSRRAIYLRTQRLKKQLRRNIEKGEKII